MAWRPTEPAVAVGALAPADHARAVSVLARAFRDNPLNVAVIGGDRAGRERSNQHGMRSLLPVAQEHGQVLVARAAGDVAAALIASPPYAYPLPPPSLWPRLRCLLGQGWTVAVRWARVFESLEALHPMGPHWYLGTLGVDPAHQGRGLGSTLLHAWLEDVDRDAASAYLETDALANVGFYERAGFGVDGEAEVLGVRIWRMHRPERGARAPEH